MPAATQHRFVDMRIADVLKVPAPPGCYIVLLEERDGECASGSGAGGR